ncbi:unnamed protein product [Aphanomyces euteiches]
MASVDEEEKLPLVDENEQVDDEEIAASSPDLWSKYDAMKGKATDLTALEMDSMAQWKWLNGRLGEAIDGYLDLARLHPKYLHVHFKLGYLYLILQNYDSAVQHFTLEIDKQAHNPPPKNVRRAKVFAHKAYFWCAVAGRMEAHQFLQKFEKRATDEALLMSDGGGTANAWIAMGCLYRQLGLLQRAEASFELGPSIQFNGRSHSMALLASQIKPNDPTYLVEYGKLLLLQRRVEGALAKFSDCCRIAPALSEELFQAMLGEAIASMRLHKPTGFSESWTWTLNILEAAQGILQKVIDSLSPMVEQGLTPLLLNSEMDRSTIRQLLFQAINSQGCCAILQGDIKTALDIYYTVAHDYTDFQLPVLCVTPGARDAKGHLVDTAMLSTDRIVDLLLYLDQIESRYGPDACLYFHRANIYRALGDLKHFIDDLTLVETLDPLFLRGYFAHDSLGDFLDEETMTWIPLGVLETICEFTKPSIVGGPPPTISLIEAAVYQYFSARFASNPGDFYAQVFMIDSLRRLNMKDELPLAMHRLREGSGISFDDSLCHLDRNHATGPPLARRLAETLLAERPNHSSVQFVAGLVRLELTFVAWTDAHHHFTQCIHEITKTMTQMETQAQVQGVQASNSPDATSRWTYQSFTRAKYHALVWRAVVGQLSLHNQEAVQDMRAAVTLLPQEPHAMFQKGVMMVHYGHLDSAIQPLRAGFQQLKQSGQSKDVNIALDYIRLAGMNVFSLLPLELKHNTVLAATDDALDDLPRRQNVGIDGHGGTVMYSNALDKMYEAGVLKLSKGHIAGAIKYFASITSIKPTYVSRAIDAMMDLHRCKDPRLIDDKVYVCHQELSQRAARFLQVYNLPLEGFKDLSACVAYYPHDVDMYWHRAWLHERLHNHDAAIDDFTQCIMLTRHGGKPRGVVLRRYMKMLLARAKVYMHEKHWELAMDDLNLLTEVTLQSKSVVETAKLIQLYELRSQVLVALQQYDAAIVEMETVLKLSTESIEWSDKTLLNMLLLANMHCHMAIEGQKHRQTGIFTTFLLPTRETPLSAASLASLRKANEYYAQVLDKAPTFPLALFLKGRMHALMGDSTLALDHWTKCLRQDPKFLVANFLKGSLRAQQCLPDLALAEFLTVRNQIPAYPHVQTSIGYCYYLQGNVKRAVVELTEALAHDPNDVEALYMRGVCLQELFALPTAISDFNSVLSRMPSHARAWYQRGMCHLLLKDYTSALIDLTKAAPHLRSGFAAVGYIHFCKRHYADAVAVYSHYLDERANDAPILLYRGFSYYRLGERTLAARDFDRALKVDSSCWFVHFIRAYIHQEEGDGTSAVVSIQKCLEHFKSVKSFHDATLHADRDRANPFFGYRLDVTLQQLKALVLFSSPASRRGSFGALDAARDTAKRAQLRAIFVKAVRRILFQARVVYALEKFAFKATAASVSLSKQIEQLTTPTAIQAPQGTFTPDSVAWAYNLVGVLATKQAKWEDALRHFTLAIRAAPSRPIPHLNRGNVYMEMRNVDKALVEFKEALQVDPNHAATMVNTALALYHVAQLEEACRYLYSAAPLVESIPAANAIVCFALANVTRELNRSEEAIEWYTKATTIPDAHVYHNRGATLHLHQRYQAGKFLPRRLFGVLTPRMSSLALQDYSTALSLAPQSFETRLNRACLYLASSKCHHALEDLKCAASLQPDSATALRLLRFCERWHAALRVACSDFLYALDVFPCFQGLEIKAAAALWDPHAFHMQNLSLPDHPSRLALDTMLTTTKSEDLAFLLNEALMCTQDGQLHDAQRALLSAKYLSNISLHEELVCSVWSAQIAIELGDTPTAISTLRQAVRERKKTASAVSPRRGMSPSASILSLRGETRQARAAPPPSSSEVKANVLSDIYGSIGCLLRADGQLQDAARAFQSSLEHNRGNMYSLFNAASIHLEQQDFSSLLEALSSILTTTVSKLEALNTRQSRKSLLSSEAKAVDLLDAERDMVSVLPHMDLLATPEILQICRSIQAVFAQYKTCLTHQVAKHIPQLCVLQGQLATHVEALRDAVQGTSQDGGGESKRRLDLNDFNAAISRVTQEMVQGGTTSLNSTAMSDYLAEYDRICHAIESSFQSPL